MGKAALIIVIGTLSVFMVITNSVNTSVSESQKSSIQYFSSVQARNIANSVSELLVAKVSDTTNFRVTSQKSMNLFDGVAQYTVKDTLVGTDSLVKVSVFAAYNGQFAFTTVLTEENKGSGFIPTTVKAAISTNNPVETKGNITVDGRQHDINGNLISNAGTYGIWTTQTYGRGGNSKVGATHSGTDIAPIKSGGSFGNTYKSGQVWPGGYPNNPDSLLGGKAKGFASGTLKSIALSGANGSQYTTNPSSLSYPLSGVTYVELPSGGTWNAANITGSGILVVHNSATNAIIKNLNTGPFKGMIIADDIIHIHTTIIGAIIGISPSPSDGNCIGNGNGRVYYSSEAINKAIEKIDPNVVPMYGFGEKRLKIVSWLE